MSTFAKTIKNMETIYKGTYYDGLDIKTKAEDEISVDAVRLFNPLTKTSIDMHRHQGVEEGEYVLYTWYLSADDTRNVPEGEYALETMQRVVANGSEQWKMLSYTPSFARIVKSSEGEGVVSNIPSGGNGGNGGNNSGSGSGCSDECGIKYVKFHREQIDALEELYSESNIELNSYYVSDVMTEEEARSYDGIIVPDGYKLPYSTTNEIFLPKRSLFIYYSVIEEEERLPNGENIPVRILTFYFSASYPVIFISYIGDKVINRFILMEDFADYDAQSLADTEEAQEVSDESEETNQTDAEQENNTEAE